MIVSAGARSHNESTRDRLHAFIKSDYTSFDPIIERLATSALNSARDFDRSRAHAIAEFHGAPCGKVALCLECARYAHTCARPRADTPKQMRGRYGAA